MEAQTSHSQRMISVHSYLDLYGLDPYEFRLLAHIARRSSKYKCSSKLEKIAVICKMSVRKAQDSLKKLDELGLVTKIARKRKTSLCDVIHDTTKWKYPEYTAELEEERKSIRMKLEEERRYEQVIFVHGYLDLYGLEPDEFRLLAHVARRGTCIDSLKNIALICKMGTRRTQYALKELNELGLIFKIPRDGYTTKYLVAPVSHWKEPKNNWKDPEYSVELEKERAKVIDSMLSLGTLQKTTKYREIDDAPF